MNFNEMTEDHERQIDEALDRVANKAGYMSPDYNAHNAIQDKKLIREAIKALRDENKRLRELVDDFKISAPVLKTVLKTAGLDAGVKTIEQMMRDLEALSEIRAKGKQSLKGEE